MLDLSSSGFFAHHFDLLGGIFSDKAIQKTDHHFEMSKNDFNNLLKECDLLIIPKKKTEEGGGGKGGKGDDDKGAKKEEEKEPEVQFDESDVEKVISGTNSFEEDQLGYLDFLEALVRVAQSYPFKEEQLAEMPTFEIKMMHFIQALENVHKKQKEVFTSKVDERTMAMSY